MELMLEEASKRENEGAEALKKLIPEAFVGKKIDVDILTGIIERSGIKVARPERYNFSWVGRADANRDRDSPSSHILVPVIEDSLDYEKTKNVFVEGDNLEVLKILRKTLRDSVKMIYIDPPYNANSGQKLYNDDFRDTLRDYFPEDHALKNREFSNGRSKCMATYGRNHSKWLTMIYPRIFLARGLLRDDGVMFVSIDDTEFANLRMIMNEVFGEENVEVMIWKKVESNEGKLKLIRRFRIEHEYILVGYKNKEKCRFRKVNELPRFKNAVENVDNDPRGNWISGNMSSTEEISVKGSENYYEVKSPGGRKFARQWKWPQSEFERLNRENRIYWGKNGNNVPRLKVFANEPRLVYVSSIIEEKGTAKSATSEILRLVGAKCFPNPKPIGLIQYLIDAAQTEQGIVMDFFAGSGTTAHAVLAQNALDGGGRSFIVVQLPTPVENLNGVSKFENIAEITRLRIVAAMEEYRRSGNSKQSKLDLGLKVLKIVG